ncbi:MAG TPA: CDP-alcohol phosphatidyltransferase family protein [Rhizomicrobium sp.]|jgi:cardiolipin synthase|nr:CDP-alcohol phosphatidyltransferase family protein [Rhizomicrobium sp.]
MVRAHRRANADVTGDVAAMIFLRNIPNVLSALRLLLAPLTAFLVMSSQFGSALFVFAFAGLSDALDGYLAKRFGLESRFGAWLDPAADKLLMLLCFLSLTAMGVVPQWLTVIVIARDAAIVVGVAIALFFRLPVQVEPLPIGKISTIIQVSYIALMLLFLTLQVNAPSSVEALSVLTAAATGVSWLMYGNQLLRALVPGSKIA